MAKVKICPNPNCKKINPSSSPTCKYCGCNILRAKAINEEKAAVELQKQETENTEKPSTMTEKRMVRICECGYHNPANERICASCGEDISDIFPTEETENNSESEKETEVTKKRVVISSLDGKTALMVAEGVTVLGRENALQDYLAEKVYVGRRQAEISFNEGELLIRDVGKTNHTYVNNERLELEKWTPLNDGDEIGLGGNALNERRQEEAAYFMVRIESCT